MIVLSVGGLLIPLYVTYYMTVPCALFHRFQEFNFSTLSVYFFFSFQNPTFTSVIMSKHPFFDKILAAFLFLFFLQVFYLLLHASSKNVSTQFQFVCFQYEIRYLPDNRNAKFLSVQIHYCCRAIWFSKIVNKIQFQSQTFTINALMTLDDQHVFSTIYKTF